MATIFCNNSDKKAVGFYKNGDYGFIVIAYQLYDGFDYWFSIGHFKTLAGAKRSAVRQMKQFGYTFNEEEMKNLQVA